MVQIAKMDSAIKVDDGVYYQMIKQGDGKNLMLIVKLQ